ncbi:MAG: phosphoenolpyruvate carboxykinase (ATP) [Pirellulaceae bacterium]|nr:phosphoenolpyruvate carboxykinase (ATP) [Pirellulaceae bacterium]
MMDLYNYGISVATIRRNLSPARLYEEALRLEPGTRIADSGALIAYSGRKTGRSPKDKRIVQEEMSQNDVWWGDVNVPLERHSFAINRTRAQDFLNTREVLYCVDGFAGWDPVHRLKVRVICSRPYHALFMHAMLIRPTRQELEEFGEPDFTIFNAGQFPANPLTQGMSSRTSVDISFVDREAVILGTEYAGEMKKGVFTVMNYLMPKRGVLSMHCSATCDKNQQNVSILFGLSGTGKTTLSADPKRMLIGDDEHCWGDRGIFNIEGGCYAKAIDLTPAEEPDIFQALRFGSVLENVVADEAEGHVDFHDTRITQNTRGAYPIDFIRNARVPCMAGHPMDVIFLTCDAFGVLPPVSRLSRAQAMYYFISGYTAKIAGTEMGVSEPQATFSPCFGGPFLVWHPSKYAELLAAKLRQNHSRIWLVNTGWTGGPHGVGQRMKLSQTRAILDAIHGGDLRDAPVTRDTRFHLDAITACPGVPPEVLSPRSTWSDPAAYDAMSARLASLFRNNFRAYASGVTPDVMEAGPNE